MFIPCTILQQVIEPQLLEEHNIEGDGETSLKESEVLILSVSNNLDYPATRILIDIRLVSLHAQ